MDTRHATINDVGRLKGRQSFQPEAGCLDFTMPEHPRLNNLARLAQNALCAKNANGIFQCNLWDIYPPERFGERNRLRLLLFSPPKPSCSGNRETSTWRVKDSQIPRSRTGYLDDISDDMEGTSIVSRNQVVRVGCMAQGSKRSADHAATFTSDQYVQLFLFWTAFRIGPNR